MKKIMKICMFIVLTLMLSSCFFHVEDDVPPLCGYDNIPYYAEPYYYDSHLECMTWYTLGYYYECVETWCYDEYMCDWIQYDYTCYPI